MNSTHNIYDLCQVVTRTSGAQQASWKGELHRLVMDGIHRYADAIHALPFSSRKLEELLEDIHNDLRIVLELIPEGGQDESTNGG